MALSAAQRWSSHSHRRPSAGLRAVLLHKGGDGHRPFTLQKNRGGARRHALAGEHAGAGHRGDDRTSTRVTSASPAGPALSVLVVDDAELSRNSLVAFFAHLGRVVMLADT